MQPALDITLSDGTPVVGQTQRARFFKEGSRDLIEISFVGTKDTVVHKVSPAHMAQFRAEWDAYCDGRPLEKRAGTSLLECGMSQQLADEYIHKNVHNLEELAVLSDAQCQQLGHGTLTLREKTRAMLHARSMRQQTERRDTIGKEFAKVGSTPAAPADNTEVLEAINKLGEGIGALVQLMTAQAQRGKPGRKPKVQD